MVTQITSGDYSNVVQLLNYGTCVKECPKTKSDPVVCYQTTHIKNTAAYKDSCVYHYQDATTGLDVPFRYPTESFVGHFCLPDGEYVGAG